MKTDKVGKGKYIVAVSGGVDSMVLLDILNKQSDIDIAVAHFDHGIRPDSGKDRRFVQQKVNNLKLIFEYSEGKLGSKASEATARKARYAYLRAVMKKHKAKAIITAHHQDDTIETAIINIIRGTNRKGLSALGTQKGVIRPLIHMPRSQILSYAKSHDIKWQDDPSNKDTSYLRNYVRLILIPRLSKEKLNWREDFLKRIKLGKSLNIDISQELNKLAKKNMIIKLDQVILNRNWLIMLPNKVGQEVIIYAISQLNQAVKLNKNLVKRSLMFCKTAKKGKTLHLSKRVEIKIDKHNVLVNALT
jgi:tRNA(Ile)-lysidine synthetase-like protein